MDSIDFDSETMRWKKQAACQDLPLNFFFDDYENETDVAKYVDNICNACPVKQQCLKSAIDTDATGVWSGKYLVLGKYSRSRNTHKPRVQMTKEEQEVNDARSNI